MVTAIWLQNALQSREYSQIDHHLECVALFVEGPITRRTDGQGGDYPRGVTRDQRRDGPIQCWRCHGFGHTQSRCPNEKKPVDYTPLCTYCSGEGHFDEDCPKRRASTGKEKGRMHSTTRAQEHVPTIGVVFKTPNPQEGSSSSMHFVDAYQAKNPHKEPTVAVVTRTQEYLKKNPEGESGKASQEKIPEHEEVENQVGGFAEQQEFEDGEEIEILPTVTVEIKRYVVPGAQLDSGAAVNLMTEYMMKALGLNHMEETPMSLRMADHTQVKLAGLLKNVSTVVGGLEFKVDYLIVRARTSEATFSILLGRPWLVQAECVHDWHTAFITIGPKGDRIQLQVSPNLSGKKSTTTEEREQKAKEKVRQEMARTQRKAKLPNPWRRELQKMS
ncbi:hypothetical protein KP509_36G034400 [Ceratopteris richardii]|uniref:CCHC-type domain-containing protein n=1 Tax=Ceratopteris richardii TaxID=49495 RepID=A0A8T2QBJ7_CERRI|nr:hypothetical protein KP509_36G034400 [Ceratopteris richardii]